MIDQFSYGGAEKVNLFVMNELVKNNFDITLIFLNKQK